MSSSLCSVQAMTVLRGRRTLAALAVAAVATACSPEPLHQPFDVGSASYPASLPQGVLQTTTSSGEPVRSATSTRSAVSVAQQDSPATHER